METCPCEKCICLPMCRNKTWRQMTKIFKQCLDVAYFLGYTSMNNIEKHRQNFLIFENCLSPSHWKVTEWNEEKSGYDLTLFGEKK
jgi:hypothetical protein